MKTIGMVLVGLRCASRVGAVTTDCHLSSDQIRGQLGQPIILALGIAILDCHVLVFDIAGFGKRASEFCHIGCNRAG